MPLFVLPLAAAIVSFGLQAIPVVSVIMLMSFAPVWTGVLVEIALINLAIDGMTGRLPFWVIVVPVAAFGAYGVLYFNERTNVVPAVEAELARLNASAAVSFDPTTDRLSGGRGFVVTFALPAYSAASEGKFTRVALADPSNCLPRPKAGFKVEGRDRVGYCLESTEIFGYGGATHAIREAADWDTASIAGSEVFLVPWLIRRGDATVGRYYTAKVETLLPIPVLILGCSPDGPMNAPIKCGWKFMTNQTELGLVGDLSAELSAVSRVFGLAPVPTAEMARWAIKR